PRENIRDKSETYKAGLPVNPPIADESNYYGNFEAEFRNFWTNGSYYCIFAGLDFLPNHPLPVLAHKPDSVGAAQPLFERGRRQQRHSVETLPSNYPLLRAIHGR